MKKIRSLFLFIFTLTLLCGCAHNDSSTVYNFDGFKIFPGGFIWGNFHSIPINGNAADSFIYYKKATKNSKEIRLIKTGNNFSSEFEELFNQKLQQNNNDW